MKLERGREMGGTDRDECGRCGLPLGARSYELSTTGMDRASPGGPYALGEVQRWSVRHEILCHWCYVLYLEMRLATGPGRARDSRTTTETGRAGRDGRL